MRTFIAIVVVLSGFSAHARQLLTICRTSCVNYTNTITSGNAVAWQWTFYGGNPGSSTQQNPSGICYPDTGKFITTIVTTFDNGNKTSDTIDIIVIEPKVGNIPLGNDTAYCGSINRLLDAGFHQLASYRWTTSPKDTNQTIKVTAPGTYGVWVKTKCDSAYEEITLSTVNPPIISLPENLIVCNGEVIHTLNPGSTGVKYLWSTGDTTQTIDISKSGTYVVTVTNAQGCFSIAQTIVRDSCPPEYYFPSAFSPNSDNLNDVYIPYLKGFQKVEFTIYDRWGEIVFHSKDMEKLIWDGFFRGKMATVDVYIYKANMLSNEGVRINVSGNITLIR